MNPCCNVWLWASFEVKALTDCLFQLVHSPATRKALAITKCASTALHHPKGYSLAGQWGEISTHGVGQC